MQILVLMSQKGGAGKSTLAVHLASESATRGHKTLLLDLDPQGNMLGWAKRRGDDPPDVDAVHASNLATTLDAASTEGYELVVIDTAPSADRVAMAAAHAASLILVPCRPAQFDLDAIAATLELCAAMNRPCLAVLNAAPPRSRAITSATNIINARGVPVAPPVIHNRVAFQHCLVTGRVASEFEPNGLAAQEIHDLYAHVSACLHADTPTRSAA